MTDDLVRRLRYDAKKLADDICGEAADRIEKLEKALRWIAGVKSAIAEEPPEKVGEETHKMWVSLILCAVSAETALEKTDD